MSNFYLEMMNGLNPESQEAMGNFFQRGNYPGGRINPYAYTGMDRRENPGDKLYADIIRAQTADYMRKFAPVEDALAASITPTGTTSLEGDLTRTREAVMGAGLNIQGQQGRSMERLGVADNSGYSNQNANISALVGGLNDTRLRDSDRRDALLTGTTTALGQKARAGS